MPRGLLRSFRAGLRRGSRVRSLVLGLDGLFIVTARFQPLSLLGREDDNAAGCRVFDNRRCELWLVVFHRVTNCITAGPSRLAGSLTGNRVI